MARPKARWFGEANQAAGTFTARDVDEDRQPIGDEYSIGVSDLGISDLYKVLPAFGESPTDSKFRVGKSVDQTAMRECVSGHLRAGTPFNVKNAAAKQEQRSEDWSNGWLKCQACGGSNDVTSDDEFDHHPVCARCRLEDERDKEQEGRHDVPTVTEPAPIAFPATGSLDALIADIARKAAAGQMDEERVRKIVREEVGSLPAPIHRIELAKRPVVELEGTLHCEFQSVLKMANAGMFVALTGAPGTGKTTLARQVAEALGINFRMLACHPQITGVSLFGFMNATGGYVGTDFRGCYEGGGLFLLDEADNGNGGILAALNAAVENGHCAFPDGLIARHKDFRVMVAMNTHGKGATAEMSGRNKLDGATVDRFTFWHVGIDEKVEEAMAHAEMSERINEATSFVAKVRVARNNAEQANLKPRLFITPRAVRDGCRMLNMGFTEWQAVNAKFAAGLDATVTEKVFAGIRWEGR